MNNPKESLVPNCIPFAFTNLSMYSQYLGKDKVVGFAQPTAEDIEVHTLADHDELAEMMRDPKITFLARSKLSIDYLSFLWIMLFLHLQQTFQDRDEWTCRMLTLHQARGLPLMCFARNTPRFSPKGTRILVEHNWLRWT